jgi:hypothetical protein
MGKNYKKIIIKLIKGEKSTKIMNFDRNKNLELLKANFQIIKFNQIIKSNL